MTAPSLDAQIDALKLLRLDAAARSQALALRELDGRLLRLKIEVQLRDGNTKTDAEKLAKVDKRYLAHEEETLQFVFERERVLAEAEATLLNVKLQLAVLERTSV